MSRIRTIKPEFHAHEQLSAMAAEVHLLAAALLNYADDEGYFNANPMLVKSQTHPLREDTLTTVEQLGKLAAMGYIEIRSCANGKSIGRVVNFTEHQRVSHPTESKLRAGFELAGGEGEERVQRAAPEDSAKPPERLRPEQGTGNRERGTGNVEAAGGSAPAARRPAAARPAVSTVFLELPLLGGAVHAVTEADVGQYAELFPAVDVRCELRKVRAWLDARPAEWSKTLNGSKQRIARWLARTQDQGGTRGADRAGGGAGTGYFSPAQQRSEGNRAALVSVAARRYGIGVADADGSGDGPVPVAGAERADAKRVPGGVGAAGAAVRADGVPGRVIEGYR